MQLFSSYESLSWLLKKFAGQLDEIEASISAWQQDDRIRGKILDGDGWATNSACLAIMVNAEGLNSALKVIVDRYSFEIRQLMSNGLGMLSYERLDVPNARHEADCSPLEYQFFVLIDVLGVVRKRVREFLDETLWPFLRSGELGTQDCAALQYYADFHLAHLEDGFLMLKALLVQGLDCACKDILAWGQRIERVISRIRSGFPVYVDEPASLPSIWCCRGHRYLGGTPYHETLLTERSSS